MRKNITLENVAQILDEDIEWIKYQIDTYNLWFAHKDRFGQYHINPKKFERYLLTSAPYFLKIHNKRR